MGVITRMRKQKAVYWSRTGVDAYGAPKYGTAVEIDVRWEDATEEFIDPEGERQQSIAIVYVDRDVTIGGLLLLGSLDSTVDTVDPKANEGAWEIRQFNKLPNFKATEFLRTVFL